MSCIKSIKTSSGTFSFSEKEMTRCEAKKYCRERGQILAPITTTEDKEAVLKMLDPDCVDYYSETFYHIGLDVYPCGDKQERVFTNGVEYNKDVHGHLYDDLSIPNEKCPQAYLDSTDHNPFTIGSKDHCYPQPRRALCLDQSTAAASSITLNEADHYKVSSTQAVVGMGAFFVIVVGSLAFAAQLYKSKNYWKNKFYESEI